MYLNRAIASQARTIINTRARLSALRSQLSSPILPPSPPTSSFISPHLNITRKMTSSSIPTTQNAVIIETTGGPEVLQFRTDQPVPSPKEGEILVKNHIAGLNFIDTYFRTGLYPSPKPEILGREAAGTIVALGSGVTNPYGFKVGDRVMWMHNSGYAQYTAVPAKTAIKIPDGVKDEDLVASFLSGLTVLTLVKETYAVQKGDVVLVHAAAGGAGILMVQILKSLGAVVIGTAGGAEKVALVKSLGADHVIDYRSEEGKDWVKIVKEITNGRGVDVVYDSVGKDTWEGSLEAVKRKGFVAWFGNASGPVPPLPIQRLSPKCIKIARPMLNGYLVEREEYEYWAGQLLELLQSGKLKVKINKIFPLAEVQQAHKDLEGRKTTGKTLLKP
ncbi:quinone oxidoreductase, putative [Talaromyces stipitatus ATCC 10500]|uniref:Probable quinone oxidoreductase n=1 Tax=Talaromyces stipitatus (strain ATCC 10500 / CBS 375.48 / QM 6759 / NRRL 1006) TaxID=441959 RepID=B8LTG2_TALSN|nr:quinone oxidoreductase, putative [Talaromyces stipitatus ATCC 10500]EED23040.1 quinone oxidoreductase, putative [Talaromyces stipitatus ATCC 10500]